MTDALAHNLTGLDYIRRYYRVPAEIGRRVVVYGQPGVIAADRGAHLGVNFDRDKPGHIVNAHPIDGVEYGEMGQIRRPTRAQQRYQRFLNDGDIMGFDSFIDFCRWDTAR